MKIFIDSAEVSEIETISKWGVCDGVTTNPTLIVKSGQDFVTVIRRIAELIDGPISAEIIATDAEKMLSEAAILSAIHKNIVIKLPLTVEGLKACQVLKKQGIATNVTLCFQPGQALLAAKCGATYISPFIGRLEDVSQNGLQLIRDIRAIYSNYGFKTQILAASIRNQQHVVDCALAGADVITAPFKILSQLYSHPLTDAGLDIFMKDWKSAGDKTIG